MVFGSKKTTRTLRVIADEKANVGRVKTSDPRHYRPVTACEIVFLNPRPGESISRPLRRRLADRTSVGSLCNATHTGKAKMTIFGIC